jgi:hypothetical protein
MGYSLLVKPILPRLTSTGAGAQLLPCQALVAAGPPVLAARWPNPRLLSNSEMASARLTLVKWRRSRRRKAASLADQMPYLAKLAPQAIGGATTAAVGYQIGGYDGLVVTAAALPYLSTLIGLSTDFVADKLSRMNESLRSAAETLGLGPEEFAKLVNGSPRTRFLTEAAMKAATQTDWPPTTQAIGRALADGLLDHDSPVDVPTMVLPAMTEMAEAHVRLLNLLVMARTWSVGQQGPQWVNDRPHLAQVRSEWPIGYIRTAVPQLVPVLPSLAGTLERYGLIERADPIEKALKNYSAASRQAIGLARRRPRQVVPPDTSLGRVTPPQTWRPTDLGKQVLGLYEVAGWSDPGAPES